MDPSYVFLPISQFEQFMNRQHLDEMEFTIHEQNSTINHRVNFNTDGNKIVDNKGNTWLHIGAQAGSEYMIEGLIRCGGKHLDLNINNKDNWTPLMCAVKEGKQKIIEMLLDAGADIGDSLGVAVFEKNIPFVKLLLQRGACHTRYPSDGSVEIAKILIDSEIISSREHNLCSDIFAAHINNFEIIEILFNKFNIDIGKEPYRRKIKECHKCSVWELFSEKGYHPDQFTDEKGIPYLHDFCMLGSDLHFVERVISLLTCKANPNHIAYKKAYKKPFNWFAFNIGYNKVYITPENCLLATKLFIENGAEIDSNIQQNYDLYLKRNPHPEVKALIKGHEKCVLA